MNPDTLLWQRVAHPHWQRVLEGLVRRHAGGDAEQAIAEMLLHEWERVLPRFWQVVPKEYARYLAAPLGVEEALRA